MRWYFDFISEGLCLEVHQRPPLKIRWSTWRLSENKHEHSNMPCLRRAAEAINKMWKWVSTSDCPSYIVCQKIACFKNNHDNTNFLNCNTPDLLNLWSSIPVQSNNFSPIKWDTIKHNYLLWFNPARGWAPHSHLLISHSSRWDVRKNKKKSRTHRLR